MTKGCEHHLKRFSVPMSDGKSQGKKCFRGDCANEGKCDDCHLIQGKYTLYQMIKPVAE